MAFLTGKAAVVLWNQYDISGYCDNMDIGQTQEAHETTCYGKTAKTYVAGLRDGTVSLGGKADYESGASDTALVASIGSGTLSVVTLSRNGSSIGTLCKVINPLHTSYAETIPVGDVITWAADIQASEGIDNGKFLHALGAETTTGAFTSVDNAAASTNGYAANIHVTAFTGTNVTIKLQHSTDDSSWSDLATFTVIAGATSEHITGTGTVNRYTRANVTAGTFTSVTFAVAIARR